MLRMTRKRQKIYDVIKGSKNPISAEDILNILGDENINLSTIYRSVEYFINGDLLLTFHFNNKTYYILNNEDNHYHYFICTNCLRMEKVDCNLSDVINELKHNKGFLVTNHEMTIYGLCNKCQF